MSGKVRVIVANPHALAEVRESEVEWEDLKNLVGGWIEGISVGPGILMYCNEEGKLQGLPYNRTVGGLNIVGTLVITKLNGKGDHISLSDDEVTHWLRELNISFN